MRISRAIWKLRCDYACDKASDNEKRREGSVIKSTEHILFLVNVKIAKIAVYWNGYARRDGQRTGLKSVSQHARCKVLDLIHAFQQISLPKGSAGVRAIKEKSEFSWVRKLPIDFF